MGINRDNVIVLYRAGDADSADFAAEYRNLYSLASSQLVPVPCSGDEVVGSYALFQSEVEDAVKAYLAEHPSVRAILVGHGVPGGFRDGATVVSTTSRLTRIADSYTGPNVLNPLYDRRSSQLLDDDDFGSVMICTRIDSPDLESSKAVLAVSRRIMDQGITNGTFFIDPFPVRATSQIATYSAEVMDFVTDTLPTLGLSIFSTAEAEPYVDLVVPFLRDDAFSWTCGTEMTTDSFFRWTSAARVFLYNADPDGAQTVRDGEGNRWPQLALRNGYAATAGSMSTVSSLHYLRPRPLFESLLAGGCLGEAVIFAMPFLDSPETVFGDPLLRVGFPATGQTSDRPTADNGVRQVIDSVAKAAGCLYRREKLAKMIEEVVAAEDDVDVSVALIDLAEQLRLFNTDGHIESLKTIPLSVFSLAIPTGMRLPLPNEVEEYVDSHAVELPEVYVDCLEARGVSVPLNRVVDAGTWSWDHEVVSYDLTSLSVYHFQIEVASDKSFGEEAILYSADSLVDPTGWSYEAKVASFEPLPSEGLPSSYAGRRVRHTVAESDRSKFTAGVKYFFRVKQKEIEPPREWPWVSGNMVVYT